MHLLKESTAKGWVTKCGTAGDRSDTTAWHSRVTCSACLGKKKVRYIKRR